MQGVNFNGRKTSLVYCALREVKEETGLTMTDFALRGLINRCRIHPVKPDKCRTFPFEWTNPDSAEVCPALKNMI